MPGRIRIQNFTYLARRCFLKIIISLFISGLIFGAGPCLASCGPVFISYIAGARKNISGGLKDYLLFSFSRILVYLLLALIVFFLGRIALNKLLGEYSRYFFVAAAGFIIFTGILLAFGKNLKPKAGGSIVLGLLLGLLPCGPLLAVLAYIGLISHSGQEAFFYSLAFGLGTLVSPLILLTALVGLLPKFFSPQKAIYGRIFSLLCGLLLIFLGFRLLNRVF